MSAPHMIPVLVRYVLRNGTRGAVHVLATSTTAALVQCIDLFGEAVRFCSARAA